MKEKRTLVVTDRRNGQIQKVRQGDPDFSSTIVRAADGEGLPLFLAWRALLDGQELASCGLVYHLEPLRGD